MSSDQIIPERGYLARRRAPRTQISGRAWVKGDLEFWHRCTVAHDDGRTVTVVLDNMDEIKVDPEDVEQFELEPGELVFVANWNRPIGGYPAFVISDNGRAVEVEFPDSLYGEAERRVCSQREIRCYLDLTPAVLKPGTQVFAYQWVQFNPPIYLLFPGTVKKIHFGVCVMVEFDNGETSLVPLTLVEQREINAGDVVHTCTSYTKTTSAPIEQWSPCRVLQRVGDNLLVQDGAGERFGVPVSMVAVLPNGYQMFDGKLEKIPALSIDASFGPEAGMQGDLYVIRTDNWRNAADDPITKAHVDELMAADPELRWAANEWDKITADERIVARTHSILWNGQACFWWNRFGIRCPVPNAEQLAKMIDMAVKLDANVIGDDGEEYH